MKKRVMNVRLEVGLECGISDSNIRIKCVVCIELLFMFKLNKLESIIVSRMKSLGYRGEICVWCVS